MSIGILKTQLAEYERRAETLEGIVLKELNKLERHKNAKDIVLLEAKIQGRLRTLDDVQEQIDRTMAELKEAGAYEYPDYSGNVYVYRLPKQPKQKPLKIQVSEAKAKQREETAKHKVYSTETTAERKRRERKAEAAKRKAEAAALREAKAIQKAQEAAQRKAEAAAQRAAVREAYALRKAQAAAERKLKPRVVKELKPRPVKPPKPRPEPKPRVAKPKPAPKPRKAAESYEMKLAKKRRDKALTNLKQLEAQIEAERVNLERRLEERKARVEAVAHLTTAQRGPQHRRTARINMENVERQLQELPERKKQREERLLELIDIANEQIRELENV